MSNNFLSIENEKVLTRQIKPKNVVKYMYKTKVNILFKYTSSRNVLFRYDTYNERAQKHRSTKVNQK